MKKMNNVYRKTLCLLTGALMLCMTGCEENIPMGDGSALVLNLTLQDSQIGGPNGATRADENGLTGENAVSKLDVLAYQGNTGDLVHHYQLSNVNIGGNTVVDSDWESTGYTVGTNYHFYVIANAPAALAAADLSTEDKLKAFTFTEADAGFFSRGTDFVMDGYKGYTFSGTGDQYLNDVQLARAAAKLELKVQIGPNLKSKMAADELYLHYPSYKASRFAMNTSVIADADNYPHVYATSRYTNPFTMASAQNADAMAAHLVDPEAQELSYEKYIDPATEGLSYTLRAYSYSFSWTAAEALEKAPYMLVSFPFRGKDSTDDNDRSYHYYLVPLVSSSTHSIDRNHLYRATAVIDSYGSAEEVVDDVEVNVNYEVIPWGTNTQTEGVSANISATDMTFLAVSPERPAIYEGDEGVFKEVVLHYSASNPVTIVDHPAYAALRTGANINPVGIAFYNDKYGVDTVFPDTGAGLTDDGDNQDNYEVIHDAVAHTITVRSMVPTNKAMKKIAFTLSMEDKDGNVLTKDVVVRHFPTDFIVNLDGWWSSKINASFTVHKTVTQYKDYTYYLANKSTVQRVVHSSTSSADYVIGYTYGSGTLQERWAASPFRSESTAVQYTKGGKTKYAWYENNRFYDAYYESYSLGSETTTISTTNWVNWGIDGSTYQIMNGSNKLFGARVTDFERTKTSTPINPKYEYNMYYYTNTFNASDFTAFTEESSPLGNYHMYVLQNSSTRDDATLGKPVVSSDLLSNDNVVSPAFIVASHLGNSKVAKYPDYPSTMTNDNKWWIFDNPRAICAQYKEVSRHDKNENRKRGKVFTGWRLPTQKEIDLIINYEQYSDVMDELLPAGGYFCLSGFRVSTHKPDSDIAIRCVRDLTPEDIRYINGEMSEEEINNYLDYEIN